MTESLARGQQAYGKIKWNGQLVQKVIFMSLFPEVHESTETPNSNFLKTFLNQLEIQSGAVEAKGVSSSHPDVLIRSCLKGLLLFLSTKQDGLLATELRVADIGCSLNFGLRASVKGKILQTDLDTLTDTTTDQIILNSLKSRKPPIEYALGIDIQEPDFEWVAACAYFSKYDENRKTLQKYRDLIEKDIHNGVPIHGMVGDISNDETVTRIQANQMHDFHILYGSMVFYQLSPEMQLRAFHNVSSLLAENGLLAELTFKNPNNWFLPWNTTTTLRFKENGALSRPYQWLDWDSSRCAVVKEGDDFQEANLRLANL